MITKAPCAEKGKRPRQENLAEKCDIVCSLSPTPNVTKRLSRLNRFLRVPSPIERGMSSELSFGNSQGNETGAAAHPDWCHRQAGCWLLLSHHAIPHPLYPPTLGKLPDSDWEGGKRHGIVAAKLGKAGGRRKKKKRVGTPTLRPTRE